MWWKPDARRPGAKAMAIVLPILILAVIVGTRFTATAGQPEGPKTAAVAGYLLEEAPVGVIEVKEEPARDERETPAIDANREAAAGPQPDDRGALSIDLPAVITVPADEEPSRPKRVGIQAGHWKSAELPAELARLRTSTGTYGGGVAEWELNLDIARRVAPLLEAEGIEVDILPSTIPPRYQADAFVALHADGDLSGRLTGFKLARARMSVIPDVDDALLDAITEEYRDATKLRLDSNVTRNMTGYYAFSNRRFEHAIAPTTPAVILEMGFLTSASDRLTLLGRPDAVAQGIAQGILRFLDSK